MRAFAVFAACFICSLGILAIPTIAIIFDQIPGWELQDGVNRLFALFPWLFAETALSLVIAGFGTYYFLK